MLRFDVPPVWSNAVRVDALLTFAISAAALLGFPYLVPVLSVMSLVRGFLGHHRCPSHRLYAGLLQKLGMAGKQENAGAKMFANKLLLIASTIATVLYLAGSGMWVLPVSALLVFSFLESLFSFCVACWAYTLWYRLRGA
ncbi:MAG: hypothetical protein H6R19_692 [Proteobacteria bacterium]|nr:hypothetical protein [Pseudomonadota bacterium]